MCDAVLVHQLQSFALRQLLPSAQYCLGAVLLLLLLWRRQRLQSSRLLLCTCACRFTRV